MVKNLQINFNTKMPVTKSYFHNIVKKVKSNLSIEIESLIINFVDEKEILRINQEFLEHHYSTDIITFNYSGNNELLDGEIFISVDDASYNASKYKVNITNELERLVIHGILHLIGLDDLTVTQKKLMRKKENELLACKE